MEATYTEGSVDPISRLRAEIPDVTIASATFDDAELTRWLDDTLSDARLLIYLPSGTDGATAATAQITLEEDDPNTLRLTLQRTIGAEAANTKDFAPGRDYPRLEDLVDWIGSLDKGWRVGFRVRRDVEVIDPASTSWLNSLVKTASLAKGAPCINLAATGSKTAYGSSEVDAAEFRFYQFFSAVVKALDVLDRGGAMVESKREVDMSIKFDVARRLDRARHRAGLGLYAT